MVVLLLVVFYFLNAQQKVTAQETSSTESSSGTEFFPLKEGNYWLYQGIRRWSPVGSTKVFEKPVSWKMEVTEVIARDFITAAVIKGHPQDVAYDAGTERGDYLILAIGEDRYYLLEGLRVNEVEARLKNKKDFLANLVFDDELFIKSGQGTIDPQTNNEQRQDSPRGWTVAGIKDVSADHQETTDPKFHTEFRLKFESKPNQTSIDFVPGIGITRYHYRHQGQVAEADLKLIEYFAG